MGPEEKADELIDRYILGKLEGEELAAFEQKMAADPAFKEEVAFKKMLAASIKHARKQELKNYIKQNTQKRSPNAFWQRNRMKLSIAAVLALGIGGAIYFLRNRNEEPENMMATKDTLQNKTMAALPPPPPAVKKADSVPAKKDTVSYLAEKTKQEDTQGPKGETTATTIKVDSTAVLASQSAAAFENVPSEYYSSGSSMTNVQPVFINDSIKEDVMLRDTVLYPQIVMNDEMVLKSANRAAGNSSKDMAPAPTPAPLAPAVQSTPAQAHKPALAKKAEAEKQPANGVDVEFWRSPVHYKGYKYFRNNLKLYGVHKGDSIKLLTYQGELYMYKGGNYYRLKEEDAFNDFKIFTDKEILKHFAK